jgi:hypothetical protein
MRATTTSASDAPASVSAASIVSSARPVCEPTSGGTAPSDAVPVVPATQMWSPTRTARE